MTPKMEPTWSQNQAPVRGASGRASGSDLGGSWRVQEAPQRAPQERPGAPQEAQNDPQEAQHEPQEAPDDPQEGQNEPQEGQSELREVPGGFRERFGEDFRSIFKQGVATETLPAQTAGEGA